MLVRVQVAALLASIAACTAPSPPETGIAVLVRTVDGVPIAGARVHLHYRAKRKGRDTSVTHLTTSADGRVTAPGLPPGLYRVRLADAGQDAASERTGPHSRARIDVKVELAAGTTRDVELVTVATGRLRAEVTGFDPARDGTLTFGLRRLWSDGVWRPVSFRYPGPVKVLSVTIPAPARYTVVVYPQGRHARTRTVDVTPVGETRVAIEVGAASAIAVRLSATAGAAGRFNLNPVDGRGVALGVLRPGPPILLDTLCAPRPGDYLLVLWDQGIARTVEVADAPLQTVRVAPPAAAVAKGKRTVRVRVGSGRIAALCVGLRPVAASGPWLRFEKTSAGEARFDGVADGEYEVLVFDGVFGVTAGFAPNPVRTRVTLRGEDVAITVPLPAK